MKILFTGGGTAGSVTPLLAIYQEFKKRDKKHEFFWIGTYRGPEQQLIPKDIEFNPILSGKFRRYVHWRNFVDPFFFLLGFFQALLLLISIHPHRVISAGGFVGVPVLIAAHLLRIPVHIHQLDIRPTLSNKITAFCCSSISVTYEKSLADYGKKAVLTGAPVRTEILQGSIKAAHERFDLPRDMPVVLIFGGGTGALAINELVKNNIDALLESCSLIHVYGEGRDAGCKEIRKKGYYGTAFLKEDFAHALAFADIVVSRAGLGTLNELAATRKPAIIIPIPDSHQEDNAAYFEEQDAIIYLRQQELTPARFIDTLHTLLRDENQRELLSENIGRLFTPLAEEKIVDLILK